MVFLALIGAIRAALAMHQEVFPAPQSEPESIPITSFVPVSSDADPCPAVFYDPVDSVQEPYGLSRHQDIMACLSSDPFALVTFTPDEQLFFIDTGASITITNDSNDFPHGF